MIHCTAPYVIDGDSLRCGNVGEVRLLGIDAPDKTYSRPCVGHYGDHVCDDRAARQATWNLRQAMRLGPIRLEPVTRDRYGRMVAVAYAGSINLSCWQLRSPVVRYMPQYDNGQRIARACAR